MTTTISDHRTAIKALVATVSGLSGRTYDYAPQQMPFPAVVVGFPTAYDFRATTGGAKDMTIPVNIYVGYGSNRAAEDALEALVDPVCAVIETVDAYAVVAVKDFQILENTNSQPVALHCTVDVSVYG